MSKFSEIVNSSTPTLVDFYATWCGPCKAMAPILDQVKNRMGDKIRILKIDVDKNVEVSNRFKIRSVPTLMLFKNGEILWRQNGGMDAHALEQRVKSVI
jgi:thioredoxin 1